MTLQKVIIIRVENDDFYKIPMEAHEKWLKYFIDYFRTTQYTPYQPEIAQGRLESLLNYQTMVSDLTGLEVANASLLDEGTAASEALALTHRFNKRKKIFVSDKVHPQTISVIATRAESFGLQLQIGDVFSLDTSGKNIAGILVQYPDTQGSIHDFSKVIDEAHSNGVS